MSLNLEGRKCVVIGGPDDREAVEKVRFARGVRCTGGADLRRAALRDEDLAGAFFVISTPQDAQLSARLRALADRAAVSALLHRSAGYGFVAMAAIVKAGPVRIAISTGGLAPRVGKILKNALAIAMDARFARFIENLARQRERAHAAHPAPEESGCAATP